MIRAYQALVRLKRRIYYAVLRWTAGEQYGCGRCHHAHWVHYKGEGECTVLGCPCDLYSVERVKI